jgi:mRNA interferase RelE/StbE
MFQVLYSPGARRALKKMPKETAKRIVEFIDALGEVDDPKRYIKKLRGTFEVPVYSFRVGDHRVILNIREEVLIIYVIDVGNRSIIYRKY